MMFSIVPEQRSVGDPHDLTLIRITHRAVTIRGRSTRYNRTAGTASGDNDSKFRLNGPPESC